jgi:type I protein arginine methyltransferase
MLLRSILYRLKTFLESSEYGRNILYDSQNRAAFSNLYSHEQMLADMTRINFYDDGIRRYVKQDDIIMDLGTGTGILSFLAARRNPQKIYSIDHSDVINIARQIAEHNDIDNISFMQINSRDFSPNEKLDAIIHEQIGVALFDENMVENLLDLKKRLLKESGRILPGKFELFLEPVCLKRDYRTPYIWENEIHGIDFSSLKNMDNINKYKPTHYSNLQIEHNAVDHFLCKPEACLSFDLNEMNDKAELPKLIEVSKRVIQSGSMDGICLYFRAIFDDEITLDNSPLHTRTSWKNFLFRTESKHYTVGDFVSFRLNMEVPFSYETWSMIVSPN